MLTFPPAKINLGLRVVRRREDGYHDLQSVMVPIPLYDALEAIIDPELEPNEVVFTRSGLPVPGDAHADLCMKAVRAIQARGELPGLRIHLHKVIPMGAGLGGGSSDGSHTLLLLNDLLSLHMDRADMHAMALDLGSDCPFFLEHGPQLAEGRGDRLRPVQLPLQGLWSVLVNPGIHVPTGEVFRNTTPTGSELDVVGLLRDHPLEEWDRSLPNTMEEWVSRTHPAVAALKRQLQDAGAAYAAMSGSGSTVFGLFREMPPPITWPAGCRSWTFRL
jgi:4-diphosphocytidyl-2-C-methyl-D-erythritol kinase